MAKRYLGYGYTNAQGVAKLEYDPSGNALTHSYTGVGAGKLQIVAESGTLQSETYELLDCMLIELESATYGLGSAPATHSVIKTFKVGTNSYAFTTPFTMEFDVESITNPSGLRIRVMEEDTSPIFNRDFSQLNVTGACSIKIIATQTDCKFYVDNSLIYTGTGTAENPYGVSLLQLKDNVSSITISNVKSYPI